MSTTLTALFATAIHEARNAEADPTGIQRVSSMLVTAAGARRLTFVIQGDDFWLNEVPVPPDAPGRDLVHTALARHATARLVLPAGLTARQWRDLAELYASAPGLYPTAEHVRAAVMGLIPGATFGPLDVPLTVEDLDESDRAIPGLSVGDPIPATDPSLGSANAERSGLSTRLQPMLDAGAEAAERRDWNALAQALERMHDLAWSSDDATRAIIAQERRRVVPAAVLEQLVRQLPAAGAGSRIGQALTHLGAESADAIFDVLSAGVSRADRRTYLDILTELEGVDGVIARALGSPIPETVRDAAEVAGRRRMGGAIPTLAVLLRHDNEQVRTSAWHALEAIGTPEAMMEISRKR